MGRIVFSKMYFIVRVLGFGLILSTLAMTRCASGAYQSMPASKRERLDVLTSFTLYLSKRDFVAAANVLSREDRERMAGQGGEILPEYQERLRAMRLTTLLNNPQIKIERGKVEGIFGILPVVDEGKPGDSASFSEVAPAPSDTIATTPDSVPKGDAAQLRKAVTVFFKSVMARDWPKAMGLVSGGERNVFVGKSGALKPGAAARLASIDTTSWEALTLKDGKLTGIILLVPPSPEQ